MHPTLVPCMNYLFKSNVDTENRLLSLHAYVAGHENAFLSEVVAPVLNTANVPVSAFFFLRYWRGGPHLRLRFRTPGAHVPDLHGHLVRRYEHWRAGIAAFDLPDAADHAALATRFAALEGAPAETALMPCPALVDAPYQPESEKYGGDAGLAIAEHVWRASSAAVLSANGEGLLNGGTRLGLGLQMSIIAVRAFGLDLAQAGVFFGASATNWQHYCPGPASPSFEERLARQANGLRTLAAGAWELQLPSMLEDWHAAMRQACGAIFAQAGALAAAMAGARDLPPEQVRNYLLSQYLHTNNNRLGIGPTDEWLLARLAQAALEPVHQIASPEEIHACDTGF